MAFSHQQSPTTVSKHHKDANPKFREQAQTKAKVAQLRSATLGELEQLAAEYAKNGDLAFQVNEIPDNDEIPQEELQEMDADLQWGDEDELTPESNETEEPETAIAPDATPLTENDTTPFREGRMFTIQVIPQTDGTACCHFTGFGFAVTPTSSRGETFLYELSRKQYTLDKLAEWLQENRQEYLRSGNVKDLTCKAFDEIERGFKPFLQKSFFEELKTTKGIDMAEDTFNKYLQGGIKLAWPDGQCDLGRTLFGEEAKLACSVAYFEQYCTKNEADPFAPAPSTCNMLREKFKVTYDQIRPYLADRQVSITP